MKLKGLGVQGAFCVLAAFLFSITPASAAVIGHLDVANCAGGGVIVNATTIDFTLPVGGGNGCIQTGTGTNVRIAVAVHCCRVCRVQFSTWLPAEESFSIS